MTISENVTIVKENIARAAVRSGRSPSEITLLAACKMNDASRIREAFDAGITVFGENRANSGIGVFKYQILNAIALECYG